VIDDDDDLTEADTSDPDILQDAEMDDDEEVSYVPINEPWVQAVLNTIVAHYNSLGAIFVLSPSNFAELTINTFESMNHIMNPGDGTGSLLRYFVRFTPVDGSGIKYFLIKQVKKDIYDVEVGASLVISTANVSTHLLPPIGGTTVIGLLGVTSYYVIVAWKLNTVTIDTFIHNKMALGFPALTTKRIMLMCANLLQDVNHIWEAARFVHLDTKGNQILLDTHNLELYLIDFGLIAYNFNSVATGHLQAVGKSTRSFIENIATLIDMALHPFVSVQGPHKVPQDVMYWNKQRRRYRGLQISLQAFIQLIQSYCE